MKYSDVTSHNLYLNRRKFIEALGCTSLAFAATPVAAKQSYSTTAKPNTVEEITNYNNFYEFGTHKKHPHLNSGEFKPKPWSVKIDGLVKKPMTIDLENILSKML